MSSNPLDRTPDFLAFSNALVTIGLAGASADFEAIHELAMQHGLLREEVRKEPCGDDCACSEHAFPTTCYRKTYVMAEAGEGGADSLQLIDMPNCPFDCGHGELNVSSNAHDNFFVTCTCGAEGPSGHDEQEAMRAWAKRR